MRNGDIYPLDKPENGVRLTLLRQSLPEPTEDR
jgi:hypothetical protein